MSYPGQPAPVTFIPELETQLATLLFADEQLIVITPMRARIKKQPELVAKGAE